MAAKTPRRNSKPAPATNSKAKATKEKPQTKAAAAPRATRKPAKSNGSAKTTTKSKQRAEQNSDVFYLLVEHTDLRIVRERPAMPASSAVTFGEARDMAIEHLIMMIDGLERSLWEIKRAADFEGYQGLLEAR